MSSKEAVPEEVWGLIFRKVDSVRDMGRLARVNRLFNGLITNAITQVRAIRIGPRCISLNTQLEEMSVEHRFAELRVDAPGRALSLVEKVAREADNLEGVVLGLDGSLDVVQEYCALVSQCLRLLMESDKPKLKAFRLLYDAYLLPGGDNIIFTASADFLASKAATLKRLSLLIWIKEGPLPPPFLQALQSCTQLETVKLLFHDMRDDHVTVVLLDSLLAGVHGLKSLQLQFFLNRRCPIVHIFRRNDLRSVRHLNCQVGTLENYVSTCQATKPRGQRFSMGDHPLQNIQELTLNYCSAFLGNPIFLSSFPFEDFPQLRLLRLGKVDAIELPRMVAKFLSVFSQQTGPEKTLELQVWDYQWVERDDWPIAPPLDDRSLALAIQEAVGCFCPTLSSDPECPNKKLIFQSGNAAFKIKVESYRSK